MSNESLPAYRQTSLPAEARAADIVSRLSLEEKCSQMMMNAPAIDRLGITEYEWWNECLHGVARSGVATVFPQSIGLAAMWDTKLMRAIGDVVSTEARAKHHQAVREGNHGRYYGLTFWTPTINILRDPRWGRGQETFGEDPFLTARLGVAYVLGLQGDDKRYLKITACAKHFAAHSGPEGGRASFDAKVSLRDLRETYLPAFEALVRQAKVASVMGAYNRLNGQPCCASKELLTDILRNEWGFDGHVVSDCSAICQIYQFHKTVETPEEAAAMAVNAGCDLNCGKGYSALARAVHLGLISEDTVNKSLTRLFRDRMRLGMFDPPESVPYAQTPYELNDCPAHASLALKAARKSVVLLKNSGVLPITPQVKTIAVVGPNADDISVLLGNYNGEASNPVTPLEGIKAAVGRHRRVLYAKGCELVSESTWGSAAAIQVAKRADLVIACMGISPALEGEEGEKGLLDGSGDRRSMGLPPVQQKLLEKLVATGKPVVLVLLGGSALAVDWAKENVDAMLMAWYGGQACGTALAEILTGKVNPSGKLPMTIYKADEQLPPFDNYDMAGRTYKYFHGQPLYPFGYGLSYTTFAYSNLVITPEALKPGRKVAVSVEVANTGSRAGEEIVQMYVAPAHPGENAPIRRLAGFQRVALAAGKSRKVKLTIQRDSLARIDDSGQKIWEPGEFIVSIGGGQPLPDTPGNVLTGRLRCAQAT